MLVEILQKALELKGLSDEEINYLIDMPDSEVPALLQTAQKVKEEIYGQRMVLFAPLYLSNACQNECLYCAFRAQNKALKRKTLGREELREETLELLKQGHKRVLLVAGESLPLPKILQAIDEIYSVQERRSTVKRINVNIAPLRVDEFSELAKAKIGTYQLFQETYHRETYQRYHVGGPKSDYDYRYQVMDRAMLAGIHDVGMGVLFGLYDWRFELKAMMKHIRHLERKFGIGPHTISVPRLNPAFESNTGMSSSYLVNDYDFKRIVAILRCAVPYTGIILSTRERPDLRREIFSLGVSQISAGSKTNPGGSYHGREEQGEQFAIADTRSLRDVISQLVDDEFIPSFCTGCYRLKRVGADFMDLAKPGLIKEHCLPNALYSFAEYLYDFADAELRTKGFKLIRDLSVGDYRIEASLQKVAEGARDIYV